MKFRHVLGASWTMLYSLVTRMVKNESLHTFDQSSISSSPTVVSMMTRPFVGKAMCTRQVRSFGLVSIRQAVQDFNIERRHGWTRCLVRAFETNFMRSAPDLRKHVAWVSPLSLIESTTYANYTYPPFPCLCLTTNEKQFWSYLIKDTELLVQ